MGELALGEFLVSHGLLMKDGLRRALEAQTSLECRLGSVVLDLGLMPENLLLKALGRYSSARTVSARNLASIPPEIVEQVPARFALRHQVVPFQLSGKTLSVATIDPADLLIEDELGQLTGCMIASFVAHEVRLHQALAKYYGMELSVQASSLLKRLPAADEAVQESDDAAVGSKKTDSTDVLTEVVESGKKKSRPSFRAGLATRRDPDSTMIVELSEDELADFPSLRGSLDDTDAGQQPETPTAEQPQPPDSIKVDEQPAASPPPQPLPPPPVSAGDQTVVAPPPVAADVSVDSPARQPQAPSLPTEDETVIASPAVPAAGQVVKQPVVRPPAAPPVVRELEPPAAEASDDLGTMMIAALPGARAAAQPQLGPPPKTGEETHPHARPDEDSKASTGPLDPIEACLSIAAGVLQAAEMREDIADAVMEFCASYLKRRLLLAVRDNTVIGWRGEGDRVDVMWVKSMAIPLDEPSVFVSLAMGKEYWRGSLPPTPANQELLLGLGGEQPSECVILPLVVRSKPIAFLYGEGRPRRRTVDSPAKTRCKGGVGVRDSDLEEQGPNAVAPWALRPEPQRPGPCALRLAPCASWFAIRCFTRSPGWWSYSGLWAAESSVTRVTVEHRQSIPGSSDRPRRGYSTRPDDESIDILGTLIPPGLTAQAVPLPRAESSNLGKRAPGELAQIE